MVAATEADSNDQDVPYNRSTTWQGRLPLNYFPSLTETRMATDPRVDLTFSLFKPRYIQTGVDPFDLERMTGRIDRWEDWCAVWSKEAFLHEHQADIAAARGEKITAAEAYLRASIYYHYAKHYFL